MQKFIKYLALLFIVSVFADPNEDLMKAILAKDISGVQKALKSKADPNKADNKGDTPLFKATKEGSEEIVSLLLKKGANPNRMAYGVTSLSMAIGYGYINIVRMLLEAGAEPNKADNICQSPLDFAVYLGRKPEKREKFSIIIRLLLERGAKIPEKFFDSSSSEYQWAKSLIINEDLFRAIKANDRQNVKKALMAGADPNAININGLPHLHVAILNGFIEIILLLLDYGADPNKVDSNGNKPLFQVFKLFRAERPILNNPKRERFLAIIRLLSQNGAIVPSEMRKKEGQFPRDPLVQELITNEDLIKAIKENNLQGVAKALDAAGDPNTTDGLGYTALNIAAEKEYEDIVRLLLEKGADPNRANNRVKGRLPLSSAMYEYNGDPNKAIRIIRLLLAKGADPKVVSSGYDQIPLYQAARRGYLDIVRLLLEKGADPNKADEYGYSALQTAARHSREEIVQLLLENDADPNNADRDGDTPLSGAVDSPRERRERAAKIIRLLLKYGAGIPEKILDTRNAQYQWVRDIIESPEKPSLLPISR